MPEIKWECTFWVVLWRRKCRRLSRLWYILRQAFLKCGEQLSVKKWRKNGRFKNRVPKMRKNRTIGLNFNKMARRELKLIIINQGLSATLKRMANKKQECRIIRSEVREYFICSPFFFLYQSHFIDWYIQSPRNLFF